MFVKGVNFVDYTLKCRMTWKNKKTTIPEEALIEFTRSIIYFSSYPDLTAQLHIPVRQLCETISQPHHGPV